MSKTLMSQNQPLSSAPARGECQFSPPHRVFTVGHVLKMHCQWPADFSLTPPVSIKPLKEAPFRLVILRTVSLKPGEGVFEVTGYQPGQYQTPLTLWGKDSSLSASLQWNIDSVLKPGTVKPYPPYGPWLVKAPYPLWWGLGFLVFLMLAWGIGKGIQKYRRKKWLHTLAFRTGGKDPLFVLTRELNRLTRRGSDLSPREGMEQLKIHFTDFLENKGADPLRDLSFRKILRQVKKFEGISPLQKKRILEFLSELEKSVSVSEHISPADLNRLLVMGREVAIDLHSPVRGKGGV